MRKLNTFISSNFRPDIVGGTLDKAHQSRLILKKVKKEEKKIIVLNAVCFGPKTDKVLVNLEHAVTKKDKIEVLYYEDIHNRWSFTCTNNEQYIILQQSDSSEIYIKARTLYVRGCYIEPSDKNWSILGELFNFVDMWNGKLICPPSKQLNNESKLYQLNNSLRKCSKNSDKISIGKSHVLKGRESLENLDPNKEYIVKSLSGVRSIVVDCSEFKSWNSESLCNTPVLFQEKVRGSDVRSHIINQSIFTNKFGEKEKVDYRYDQAFNDMEYIEKLPDDMEEFICNVSEFEGNNLMGLDFIYSNGMYTVLEANPCPGWSAYHECNGIENNKFVKKLIETLKDD